MGIPKWEIAVLMFFFALIFYWLHRSRSRKRHTVLEMKHSRQQQDNRERGSQELPQNETKQNILELEMGDRVELSGGYDMTPNWLGGKDFYPGTVIAFLPRDGNETPYVIVRSDEKIAFDGFTGDIVVLSLRYKDAQWSKHETVNPVNLYLLDSPPQNGEFYKKGIGKWMESHASYRVIS